MQTMTLDVGAALARAVERFVTNRVRCEECGREQTVDVADCLNHGWPMCHGLTMTLLPPQ
jgi:hypothetical protein